MKHVFTLILMSVLMALPASAGEPAVKFVLADATEYSIAKANVSRILLEAEQVVVVPVEGDQVAYDKANITRVELNAEMNGNAIGSLRGIASLRVGGDYVSAQSLPAGSAIAIYTTDGRCISSQKAANGNASLPISGLGHGTYIVRAGKLSLKFTK